MNVSKRLHKQTIENSGPPAHNGPGSSNNNSAYIYNTEPAYNQTNHPDAFSIDTQRKAWFGCVLISTRICQPIHPY